MKKRFSAVLSVLLIAALCLSLAACGESEDVNQNFVNATFTEYLAAVKVGNIERETFNANEGGLNYKEDGLWGVMSLEGAYDTGAKYEYCIAAGPYFEVALSQANSYNDLAGLNRVALINGRGRTIIPAVHASYKVLNERYVQAYTVTERIYLKDDALVKYATYTDMSKSEVDEEAYFKGTWCVYDVTTGKIVSGVSGTNNEYVFAKGRFLEYTDDAGAKHTVDNAGNTPPEGARLFDDGGYLIEGRVGDVYNGKGEKLFSYDLTGFQPITYYEPVNGMYIASKYVDDVTKYAVMDSTGKIVSAEFNDSIELVGDLILCEDKVYNLAGENVITGEYDSLDADPMFGQTYMLRKDEVYTMIDKNGGVFYNGGNQKDVHVYSSEYLANKEVDGDRYFYSHKSHDYTIKGYSFAPWVVKVDNANNMHNLVDTMTGNVLMEGYNDYSFNYWSDVAYYVYAKYNGGADVYLVVSGSQLDEVNKKKGELLDELIAAFQKEGINVSVNKETGELALDSNVLFQPDKAELTAQGKADLVKFVKVYSQVAFSEKYAGFINKTMIEGHIAPVAGGTYASGLGLSEERADVVKTYCLSAEAGINNTQLADSLQAIGYSNSQPVYNADGTVNMAASRRVSFRFMMNIEL